VYPCSAHLFHLDLVATVTDWRKIQSMKLFIIYHFLQPLVTSSFRSKHTVHHPLYTLNLCFIRIVRHRVTFPCGTRYNFVVFNLYTSRKQTGRQNILN
jgi:hypothetical protein